MRYKRSLNLGGLLKSETRQIDDDSFPACSTCFDLRSGLDVLVRQAQGLACFQFYSNTSYVTATLQPSNGISPEAFRTQSMAIPERIMLAVLMSLTM